MLAWLDFDSDALDGARTMLRALQEKRTIDHLAMGKLRDDLADYFFPATSTIMPHTRYLFMVPKAFEELRLECRKLRLSSDQAWKQLGLIEAKQGEMLMDLLRRERKASSLDSSFLTRSGIIGWENLLLSKGEDFVSQTPSNNYWASLRKLKIFNTKMTRARFVNVLVNESRRPIARKTVLDEEAEGLVASHWHKDIATLMDSTSLDLNYHQANFLRERYGSFDCLFGRLIKDQSTPCGSKKEIDEYTGPWDYPFIPDQDKVSVEVARKLSALMKGATLIYGNLVLEEYNLGAHNSFSSWPSALEEWLDAGKKEISAAAALKFKSQELLLLMPTTMAKRGDELAFLNGFQVLLSKNSGIADLVLGCRQLFTQWEKRNKPSSHRLGRIWGRSLTEDEKLPYTEKVLRQSFDVLGVMEFRWQMAAQFLWQIKLGLDEWPSRVK